MQKHTRRLVLATLTVACVGLVAYDGFFSQHKRPTPVAKPVPPKTESRWGADYFPNVVLTTHDGKQVRFFDDLIKDKVVMINFIYTSCPDSCPLETARLAEVAKILEDRVGKDVFVYSITIDPKVDTPEVLAEYRKRYQAPEGWTFLTGNEADITRLRKKLGLYIAEIQSDDSNDHNLSLIIGNQKTGRWMKRSPFENAYVLAKHVGAWLHDWKVPSKKNLDFKNAPKLRKLSDGERLFRTRCAACHTIGGEMIGGGRLIASSTGPDLLNVSRKRKTAWLKRWISEPDKMLAEKDPIATKLFVEYNKVPMPNMRLGEADVTALLAFLKSKNTPRPVRKAKQQSKKQLFVRGPWIRSAPPQARAHAGYLTVGSSAPRERTLVKLSTPAYEKAEIHEMYRAEDGVRRMRRIPEITIPKNGEVTLKPGGRHLMLFRPKKPLAEGTAVPITLHFKSGETWDISIPIQSAAPH